MSSDQDKLDQFEREFRLQVLTRLDELSKGLMELSKDVAEIKATYLKPADLNLFKTENKLELDKLKERVDDLESDGSKIKGITIGVSAVVTILGWGIGLLVLWLSGHLG